MSQSRLWFAGVVLGLPVTIVCFAVVAGGFRPSQDQDRDNKDKGPAEKLTDRTGGPPGRNRSRSTAGYLSRAGFDPAGYFLATGAVEEWPPAASLEEIARPWHNLGQRIRKLLHAELSNPQLPVDKRVEALLKDASLLNYDGKSEQSCALLDQVRSVAESNEQVAQEWLYTVIYLQGVTSLRRGETENCVMCRGESSCILPLALASKHTNPTGSRNAVKYLTEYLDQFPDDLEVRWLLNIAYMTLGEHPNGLPPRFLISIDRYKSNEHGIGRFREVGNLVGLNRLNMAGGAILDDFDNDGLLDLAFTSMDPAVPMAFYKNKGDGKFADRTEAAGLSGQLGGLNCVQADYNNDGFLDIFIPRGAWLKGPMRPSLLKNNGNGTFADVTEAAGLLHPMNTDTAQWADYDNDGWLDLWVCGEEQPSRLYRNKGNGTFEDVASMAGLGGIPGVWKGCSWFDYDNDNYPDLVLNNFKGTPKLFHNNQNGKFSDVTSTMGIDAPVMGLSCWTFDYDNDGWTDLFATCYDRTLGDVVRGLIGEPHERQLSRLYRNVEGKRFQDVTEEAGLNQCFSTMGCNFGDFDNDGFLDFYLGTGDHDIATLVPNRMFRNLAGKRFVDISSSSGTGHLQKGHGTACGDWDRDGDVDIAIEMGGAIPGDRYHNLLFLNPGQGNHWLNVKLVGKTTNAGAIGARIKAVTAGDDPMTIHRTVCSGSSFGANPLEQVIGLGKADRVATLEITWPTTGKTQVFLDVPVDQAIEITESAEDYEQRHYAPFSVPAEVSAADK